MDRYEQAAILLELIDRMRYRGSWTGETHVQKETFFLQELLTVPLGFDYILYKHGPFSFDLRDELTMLQADQLTRIDIQPYPWGPRLATTELASGYKQRYAALVREYADKVDFVAERIGNRRVVELERLATALFVSQQQQNESEETRARKVTSLKPHVLFADALTAVRFVDGLKREAVALA